MKCFVALSIGGSLLSGAVAQTTPLVSRRFDYNNLPYQADTQDGPRGRQSGYNRCNSTTEGPTSLCQTSYINSVDDFCLWGLPEPDSLVGDDEGEAVAWCTKPGRGTRVIPPGALQGVQFIRTPHYVQVTGTIRQELINIAADDSGGEMDPAGADQRGNPLGGLMFSTAFGGNSSTNGTAGSQPFRQVIWWTNFMGANRFCLKACDPSWENQARMCEHIYDRIGCEFNMPAAYRNGTFESCLGDDQIYPGLYVGSNGQTSTYTQPPESLGPISVRPYEPIIPPTSSCTPYQSEQLFASLNAAVPTTSTSTSSSAAMTSPASSGAAAGTTRPGANNAATAGQAGTTTAASSPSNSAGRVRSAVAVALSIGLISALVTTY